MKKKWDDLIWDDDYEGSDALDDTVVLECDMIALTNDAILVDHDHNRAWLPISEITLFDKPAKGETVRVQMPTWISEEKEFTFAD